MKILKTVRARELERPVTALVLLACLSTVVIVREVDLPRQVPEVAALLAVVIGAVAIARAQPNGIWSPAFLAFAAIALFHVGAVPEDLTGGDPFAYTIYDWMATPAGPRAMWVSTVGLLAFALAAVIATPPSDARPSVAVRRPESPVLLLAVARGVVIGAAMAWLFATIALGGLTPFTASYFDYLALSDRVSFVWLAQPLGVAFTILALEPDARLYRIGLIAFGVWATVAFFAGFRGEVLFPALAHLAVLGFRRRLPTFLATGTLAVAALAVISLAREVRLLATGGALTSEALSPIRGLSELGFSQFVVQRVWHWVDSGDLEFALGATYLAPVARLVARAFGLPVEPGEDDTRLFNVVVQAREGTIGGSVIGEAYFNGGLAAVILVLGAWAVLLAGAGARVRSPLAIALVGVALFAFVWQVRNAFTPIPLLAGSAVAAVVLLWALPRAWVRIRRSS